MLTTLLSLSMKNLACGARTSFAIPFSTSEPAAFGGNATSILLGLALRLLLRWVGGPLRCPTLRMARARASSSSSSVEDE